MSYYDTIKAANNMGVDLNNAIKFRKDFLLKEIDEEKKEFNNQTDAINAVFIWRFLWKKYDEVLYLDRFKDSDQTSEINEERIQRANSFPIDSLIEFKGGRCKAFCHASDSASMSHNTRANKAHCFVCNKSFSPIDVLMVRDNMSFVEAVKQLS